MRVERACPSAPPPPTRTGQSSRNTAETDSTFETFASLHNYVGSLDRGKTRVEKNDGSWRNSFTVVTNTWKAKMAGWFYRVFDPQHLAPTYTTPVHDRYIRYGCFCPDMKTRPIIYSTLPPVIMIIINP